MAVPVLGMRYKFNYGCDTQECGDHEFPRTQNRHDAYQITMVCAWESFSLQTPPMS